MMLRRKRRELPEKVPDLGPLIDRLELTVADAQKASAQLTNASQRVRVVLHDIQEQVNGA